MVDVVDVVDSMVEVEVVDMVDMVWMYTSCRAFLSVDLVDWRSRMTFLAPSTTADSMRR